MKIGLQGGFGEKGRTSLSVAAPGSKHVLFDFGIKVGATGPDYYPALGMAVDDIEAVLITHAHEDHVGALSWLMARGYRGKFWMTHGTFAEAPATLSAYGDGSDVRAHPLAADRVELFRPGDAFSLAGLNVTTGRSGHVVGGVWFGIEHQGQRVSYCGDVVPESAVFVMDAIPECDLLAIDASYGADAISGSERAGQIAAWIGRHGSGCLLPTPLSGRSLELIAAIDAPFAIHRSMRPALRAQIGATQALAAGVPDLLNCRLAQAADWDETQPLPQMPLLCDDGMGQSGPSSRLLPKAEAAGYPVLLTGHLPDGSPGQTMLASGRADWIRMPTHPTLAGNLGIWRAAGEPPVLGHSCGAADLVELHHHMPALNTSARTGDSLQLVNGRIEAA